MTIDELTAQRERVLDRPFTPRLSEIVDRIDRLIDEEDTDEMPNQN